MKDKDMIQKNNDRKQRIVEALAAYGGLTDRLYL